VGDGIGQQPIVGLFLDIARSQRRDLRRPGSGHRVIRQLHHVEAGRKWRTIEAGEILPFLQRDIAVSGSVLLLVLVQEDVYGSAAKNTV
jgi:hypothetical protein